MAPGRLLLLLLLLSRAPVVVILVLSAPLVRVSAELGRDVNLTCQSNLHNVHWYMDLAGGMRVKILRTFNNKVNDAENCDHMFKTKYGTQPGNVLVIHNVSADDFRVYRCARVDKEIKTFVKEFHLLPVTTPALPTNQSEPEFQHPFWQRSNVLIGSLVLNVFFMVLMAVVAVVAFCMVKSRQTNDLSPPAPLSPEYEEIVLMAAENTVPESCVYSQAQMPV